jgi:hypothetical protein
MGPSRGFLGEGNCALRCLSSFKSGKVFAPMDFISYRAFAKLDGISESLVRRAVKEQRLPVGPDGGIDAALAGTAWRQGNISKAARTGSDGAHNDAHSAHVEVLAGETIEDAAARLTDSARVIPPYAESMARKEFFLANLRQLEYDQKVGLVVAVADVVGVVSAQLATVRTKLLAIPSGCAPQVHRAKTVPEVDSILSEAIREALEELVADAAPAPTT